MPRKTKEKPKEKIKTVTKYFRKVKKRICIFCADKKEIPDYKNAQKLRKFVSERGKILPRRITGCCAKHQRKLTLAIKRARNLALLPFTVK